MTDTLESPNILTGSEIGDSAGRTPGSSKWLDIEDKIFTERRLHLYAVGVVVAYAISLFMRFSFDSWLFHPNGSPSCIDFSHFWVSGSLAGSADPAVVYNDSAFSAGRATLAGGDRCMRGINHFVYPPIYLFFTYPLGLMPYLPAFAAWILVTLLLYLTAIYLIVPRSLAVLVALSPFPVFFNFFLGQNGFLLAGLIGLCLALMERRPRLSGVLLGLLTFKPQLGILFPFALLASHKWRVLVSAAVTSVVLAIMSVVVFGYEGWTSFIHALVDREPSLGAKAAASFSSSADPLPRVPVWLDSVYGFLFTAGVSVPIAWAVQLAIAGGVATVVCWLWAKPLPHSLKAALLCSAAPLATPFVHGHDLCVLAIAGAFLVKDGLARGFLPGDRLVMLFAWILLISCSQDFSSGWIPCTVVLALVVRRSLRRVNPKFALEHVSDSQRRGATPLSASRFAPCSVTADALETLHTPTRS
jgi:hypothetical protein